MNQNGLLINGLCRELVGGKWTAALEEDWRVVVDREHSAVRVLGGRVINYELHMVVACDDGKTRAVRMNAFAALERRAERTLP